MRQTTDGIFDDCYKMPKMPGLWVPRLVPLTRGFVAGRTGVAALDESGELNSPYLTSWTARFYEYCHWYVIRLEKNSASLRTEAEALLQELEELPTGEVEGAAPEGPAPRPTSRSEARAAAAAAAAATAAWNSRKANADATAARRREILQRLTEIRNRINSRNRICEEELGAVADRLTAKFAAYASGVLLKPFSADVLPQLDWRPHLEDYYHDHAPLMGRISEALDETEVSHACA